MSLLVTKNPIMTFKYHYSPYDANVIINVIIGIIINIIIGIKKCHYWEKKANCDKIQYFDIKFIGKFGVTKLYFLMNIVI